MSTKQNIPQNTPEKQTANPDPSRLTILAEVQAVLDDLQAQGRISPEIKADFEAVIVDMRGAR